MQSLNDFKLRLLDSVESRVLADGTRLIKQTQRAEYLALNPDEQRILDCFTGRLTVQEVLHSLLVAGGRPKIRAFYDLILTALDKGFLVAEGMGAPTAGPRGHAWRFSLNATFAVGLSVLFITAGIVAFAATPFALPQAGSAWLVALVAFSIALSLANAGGGAVLAGFGRQIYLPQIRWNFGMPYFSLDARDAFMGGRRCETLVALQRLAIPFLGIVVGWSVESAGVILGSCAGILAQSCPFGRSAAHDLIYALFRKQHQVPPAAAKFLNTKVITQIFDWKEQLQEEKYFLLYCAYAVGWLGVVLHCATRLLQAYSRDWITTVMAAPNLANWLPMLVVGLFLVILATPLAYLTWLVSRGLGRLAARRFCKAESAVTRTTGEGARLDGETLASFLGQTLLFGQLAPPERRAVATAMKSITVKPGTVIIRERDYGDALFLLYDGAVEVLKETEAGDSEVVAQLGPGDVFGEIALLERGPRSSTVRCRTACHLLALEKHDFDRLLLSTLGAETIKSTVQIGNFLKRNALFADWHPQALLKLSREFKLQSVEKDEQIIHEKQPNDSFFLVYEGEFEVRKGGQRHAVLRAGEFCGEISLLRDGPATADVVALRRGRCLKLNKEQFLKLVSQSFLTGYAIESTFAARLGNARPA